MSAVDRAQYDAWAYLRVRKDYEAAEEARATAGAQCAGYADLVDRSDWCWEQLQAAQAAAGCGDGLLHRLMVEVARAEASQHEHVRAYQGRALKAAFEAVLESLVGDGDAGKARAAGTAAYYGAALRSHHPGTLPKCLDAAYAGQ